MSTARSIRTRRLALATAAAAGGVTAGVALRQRARRLPVTPLDTLRGRVVPVQAEDGVPLHVEVDGADGAELTIVFAHGITVHQDFWHFQRRALGDLGRLVFYDHRGHGRSGPTRPENATVDRLAADLRAVIEATAPPGKPVLLVGHSLGGITIMSLARRHPELFGDRVVGVALVDTSARLAESVLGLPAVLLRSSGPLTTQGIKAILPRGDLDTLPLRSDAVRKIIRDLPFPAAAWVMGRMAFAKPGADPALTRAACRLIRSCPTDVAYAIVIDLLAYDLRAGLAALERVETAVITGARDRLIPLDDKRVIAEAVPGAQLHIVPEAGHMSPMERPDAVNALLRTLAARAMRRRSGRATPAGGPPAP